MRNGIYVTEKRRPAPYHKIASYSDAHCHEARFRDFYSPGHDRPAAHAKSLKSKRIVVLAQTLQLICQNTTGTAIDLSTKETTMNSSMNNQSPHSLTPAGRINRFVLLGVCLIALTAMLFYGPVLLLLWRELR